MTELMSALNEEVGEVMRDDVVFIGTGRCGNTIVDTVAMFEKYPVLATNSAIGDLNGLATVPMANRILFTIGQEVGNGAGSDREKGKLYAQHSMPAIYEKLDNDYPKAEHVVIVASTAGGTGSGSAIEMARRISLRYHKDENRYYGNALVELPVRYVKIVAVAPSANEKLSPTNYNNHFEFLKELYELDKQGIISGYTILCNSKMDRNEINQNIADDLDAMFSIPKDTNGTGNSIDGRDLNRMLKEGHGMFHFADIITENNQISHIKPCPYMAEFPDIKVCNHLAIVVSSDILGTDPSEEEKAVWTTRAKGYYGDTRITDKLGTRDSERNMIFAFGLDFPQKIVDDAQAMLSEAITNQEQIAKRSEGYKVNFDAGKINMPQVHTKSLDELRKEAEKLAPTVENEKKEKTPLDIIEEKLKQKGLKPVEKKKLLAERLAILKGKK